MDNVEDEENTSCWQVMPDCLLLEIFSYLAAKDLLRSAQTCNNWCRVSYDDCLWRRNFLTEWKIPSASHGPRYEVPQLACDRSSWRSEYKRILLEAPTVQCEVLADHKDQVLHVSFSHNGSYFATCSKDASVIVWNSSYPATKCYSYDLRLLNWHCTQLSQFNESDTLLLVSGIRGLQTVLGEIAIFSMEDGFTLQCRVQNKPYDVFGTWYTDEYLLSGDNRILGDQVSCTILYLNKASQETESVYTSVVSRLYKFYNKNGLVRNIMIANCPEGGNEIITHSEANPHTVDGRPHENRSMSTLVVESNCENNYDILAPPSQLTSEELTVVCTGSVMNNADNCHSGEVILDSRDKYLIFTSGSKAFIPHKIGFKKIRPFRFQERLKFTNLKDKLAEHRAQQLQNENNHPNWLDEQNIQHLFDKVDSYVDLHGCIIGMAMSPDHKYLYVNSRPWPVNSIIEYPMHPPPIAQEIAINVIDMTSLKMLNVMYTSHKAYTPNDECFFIFLDVSNSYVASGAEDNNGYLWDRHYRNCIARLPHSDVVSAVAFNRCDESVLVTASDDHLIKVWRSLSFVRQMRISRNK